MAQQIVAVASGRAVSSASVTSLTVTVPTEAQAGDLLLLVAAGLHQDLAHTAPSGWASLATVGRTGIRTTLWRQAADGLAGAQVTITQAATGSATGSQPMHLAVMVLRGVAELGPVTSTSQASGSTTISVPPYTASDRAPLHLLVLARGQYADAVLTPPSGSSLLLSQPPASPVRTGVWLAGSTTPGASVGAAYTNSSTHYAVTYLIEALPKPDAPAAPLPPAWRRRAGGVLAGAVRPRGHYSRRLVERFGRYADGTVPARAMTGQPWGVFSGPIRVRDGMLDAEPGTGAAYLEADLGRLPAVMGARWRFDSRTGTGGTPTLAVITWGGGGIVAGGFGRPTRQHLTITPRNVEWTARDTDIDGTTLQRVGAAAIPGGLALDTDHTVEVRVTSATTGEVVLDGQRYSFAHDRLLQPDPGETWVCWEPYYGDEAGAPRVGIREVWAD